MSEGLLDFLSLAQLAELGWHSQLLSEILAFPLPSWDFEREI